MSVPGSGQLAFFASLLVVMAVSCGSRTPLPIDDPDACFEPSAMRECSDECGKSTQQCVNGFWSRCVVPKATRPCTNDCGEGIETCSSSQWGTCDVPIASRGCSTICGGGTETCMNGKWQNCDAPLPGPPRLEVTVRDFNDTHPDFENDILQTGVDTTIVLRELGPDDKPVYAGKTESTSGQIYFDQWYRDTPGVNMTTLKTLQFQRSPKSPDIFIYDDDSFFPIDRELFGNQGRNHNFHFTVELATQFRYAGGESFAFTGDDDLWVFINRRLAINLGGLHSAASGSVDLDIKSAELDIVKGNIYSFNLFFAERHTTASTFHVQTSIAEFDACQ